MKYTTPIVILVLCIIPSCNSLPGPAVGECDMYRHQAVAAVVGLITAGDNEAWSVNPGCGVARSNTQVFQWVGQYSGPIILAPGATIAWSASAFAGCTVSSFTTVSSMGGAGATSVSTATITMTSNECKGLIQIGVTIPTLYTWFGTFPINIIVPSQSIYVFDCEATGVTSNAVDPDSSSCNDNLHIVDISDDSTNDGMLTVPTPSMSDVNVSNNVTVHSNVTVNENVTVQSGGNQTQSEEFDIPLYYLLLSLGLVLIWLGENRGLWGPKVFGGLIILVSAAVMKWEAEKLGFQDVPGLLAPYTVFSLFLGGYFLIKPLFDNDNFKENENK